MVIKLLMVAMMLRLFKRDGDDEDKRWHRS